MTSHRAPVPGRLPAPQANVAGIALPDGMLVTPDPDLANSAQTAAVAWISRAPVPDVHRVIAPLAAAFPAHGLWPLVCEEHGDTGRPWTTGELSGPTAIADTAPADVLAAMWELGVPVEEEEEPEALAELTPFARAFPGLAAASSGADDDSAVAAARAGLRGRLGVVAVARPADVPAAIGWLGAANMHDDAGALSAVLRSWEDRFGAVLVGIGFDTLTVAVRRPPRTAAHAAAVAAELFAFCPDLVQQGTGTIAALAAELVGARVWQFWWD